MVLINQSQMSKTPIDVFRLDVTTRISNDLDAVIAMIGFRGSTKSGSAISLGNSWDRNFNLPESYLPKGFVLRKGEVMPRVVFTLSDFMSLITKEKLPKGSVIILDEIGVAGDSREWFSAKNKMLNQTMQTIRSRNLILFVTAPTLASFDVAVRRSLTHFVICSGRKKNEQTNKYYGLIHPMHVKADPFTGKIQYINFRVREKGTGLVMKLNKLKVPKPPAHMEKPYKRLKKFMQTRLYDMFMKEMAAVDKYFTNIYSSGGDPNKESFSNQEIITMIVARPEKFMDLKKNKVVRSAVIEQFGVADKQAKEIAELLALKIQNGEVKIKLPPKD